MLNRIVLMGRLTKDPVLHHTRTNNIPVANFSLAVDRNYSKDGERETDFLDIVAWQSRAEFVSQHFTKGKLVCVEGRLQRRKYEDADGNPRHAYEVIADSVHFAGYNKPEEYAGSAEHEAAEFDPFANAA